MKILVIDFDVIMSSCIKLYERYCDVRKSPAEVWREIECDIDINKYINYDDNILKLIARILKRYKNVKPLADGKSFAKTLLERGDTDIDLSVVEYHQNIFCENDRAVELLDFDKYDNSNWIGKLALEGRIKSLVLYQPRNAERYTSDKIKMDITVNPIWEAIETNPDEIYILRSECYVPAKFQSLFDLLAELFGE